MPLDTAKNTRITLYLTHEQKAQLDALSKAKGVTRNDIIMEALLQLYPIIPDDKRARGNPDWVRDERGEE